MRRFSRQTMSTGKADRETERTTASSALPMDQVFQWIKKDRDASNRPRLAQSRDRPTAHEERHSRKHKKYDKKDFRHSSGTGGDATKAQDGGNHCNCEKYGGPIQHDEPSFSGPERGWRANWSRYAAAVVPNRASRPGDEVATTAIGRP